MTQHTNGYEPLAHVVREGAGYPVVLLHGWGASSTLFKPVIDALAHKFTFIAPDFPGFGATPPPPTAWAVREYAEWLTHVLDEQQIACAHMLGHSFGGRVAIYLASQQPHRINKLVLTDSAGIKPSRTWKYHVQVGTFKTLRWLTQRPFVPTRVRAKAEEQLKKRGSSDYQAAAGTVRSSLVRVVNEDLRTFMPHIQAPTLLLWGEQDEDTPLADAKIMEKLIPDAGLVVFEGAGHYAYLEQVARFCTVIETFFMH